MKIFGIGLSRTGTYSLNAALEVLGFRARHYPMDAIRDARQFDALTDVPVVAAMRALACLYPSARWVMTVRDESAWLGSCRAWWESHSASKSKGERWRMRTAIYGTVDFDPEQFRRVRRAHDAMVAAYFADRPESLLELNICAGQGWETLCPFLGVPIPGVPFPHENASKRGAL